MKLFSIHLPIFHKLRDKEKSQELFRGLKDSITYFSLEAAVMSIGKTIGFYIAVPPKTENILINSIRLIWPDSAVEEIYDLNIFQPQGSHEAAYLTFNGSAKLDSATKEYQFLDALNNFFKINLIGEGVAIQVVALRSQGNEHLETNIRLAASALTPFRAKEILDGLIKSYKGARAVRSKNPKMFEQLVNHAFDQKQSVKLTVEELTNFFHL